MPSRLYRDYEEILFPSSQRPEVLFEGNLFADRGPGNTYHLGHSPSQGLGLRVLGFRGIGFWVSFPLPVTVLKGGLVKGVLITPITHCCNNYCTGE